MTCFFALKSEIASVNRTDIYRQAIKRTFADLYGVSPGTYQGAKAVTFAARRRERASVAVTGKYIARP